MSTWPVAAGVTSPSRRGFDFLPARFGEFLPGFYSGNRPVLGVESAHLQLLARVVQ